MIWKFKKKKIEHIPEFFILENSKLENTVAQITGELNTVNVTNSTLLNSNIVIKGSHNRINLSNVGSFSGITIEIHGDNHQINLNDTLNFLDTKIFMRGLNHKLVFGKCAMFGGVLWYESDNCTIQVGDWTSIERAGVSVVEPGNKVTIGQDCMISHDLTIRTSDSHPIYDMNTKDRVNNSKDVIINDHVWIGAYSHILKGVTVNENSAIGISSVVTKDVPSNCVVAGNPAKVVKRDVIWTREPITQ